MLSLRDAVRSNRAESYEERDTGQVLDGDDVQVERQNDADAHYHYPDKNLPIKRSPSAFEFLCRFFLAIFSLRLAALRERLRTMPESRFFVTTQELRSGFQRFLRVSLDWKGGCTLSKKAPLAGPFVFPSRSSGASAALS
jgi:hypothetical protein